MVSQIESSAPSEIFYPESDGQPMANNTEHFEIIVLIKGNLDILFADNPNVFIAGDLFWYPIEGNNKIKYAPDVMVALNRPKGRRSSYKQWEEGNQPPQVVFEILSPVNTSVEMDRKLLFYSQYGVEEYYIYDPANNELQVWLRGEYGLDWVDFGEKWVSPRLQINFDVSGEQWQLSYPDGQPFMTFGELMARSQAAQQQAQAAEQQAQAAQQQAQAAQQRLQQAVPRLLSMGLNREQVADALSLSVEDVEAIAMNL
ncbi:MAG: Uma2 family endonuclease [Tolypothrix carrinoi HA7290-LM1]|jgi:Uma2 family endonuclease|nr:Uma2 family endonuclease [Tolypothrix carrinoi HA7290-LM1]